MRLRSAFKLGNIHILWIGNRGNLRHPNTRVARLRAHSRFGTASAGLVVLRQFRGHRPLFPSNAQAGGPCNQSKGEESQMIVLRSVERSQVCPSWVLKPAAMEGGKKAEM